MILMYHKVYLESPTIWWVTVDNFVRQMEELRRFKVVALREYDPFNPEHVAITFDGVYENVYLFAFPVLKKFGYPFELFVVGEAIGKGNEFDSSEPYARFASIDQLKEMSRHGGNLQWHSLTHRDLTLLDVDEIKREMHVPEHLRSIDSDGFNWFAYPHGKHNDLVLSIARSTFAGALSCTEGNNVDRYQLNRITVTNDASFKKTTVSLIIPNYNYGHFLSEAIESALNQTVQPDEILFIDDCSTDNSLEIASRYKGRIEIVRNEKNLGIVDNFRKAVSLTKGDYIVFLGADNRLRSDYVEKCKRALDLNPKAAIAYTNVIIFGPRASVLAQDVGAKKIPYTKDCFLWEFIPFNEEAKKILKERNFIHGSSMYRRVAYDQAGGYIKTSLPEDHNLFYRMIEKGWEAVLVPEPLLEYRQHSAEQANTQLNLRNEYFYYRLLLKERERQIAELLRKIEELSSGKARINHYLYLIDKTCEQIGIKEDEQVMSEIFKLFPEQAIFLCRAGEHFVRKGKMLLAKKLFEQGLIYDSSYPELWSNLSYVLFNTGEYKEAFRTAKIAVSLNRDNEIYRENLALIERTIRAIEGAEEILASIVIPVYNESDVTKKCLRSILENTGNIKYEVIIVDNGSKENIEQIIDEFKDNKIRYIRSDENLGFVDGCNLGAEHARGQYIVLLNNDTEVQEGWLENLIRTFEKYPDCGACGAKLVYPDGKLQEAGGIIFSDGNGWNYGRGMGPDDPEFNFVREVDYCSGACLMVRKDLWDVIGGFDRRYSPAYYEDTDLCFEVRKRGYKVYYQPKSVVIHHEGKTAGIHLCEGFKKYQVINREKFVSKWDNELKAQFPYSPENVSKACERDIKGRILIIDHFLPFFDRASGSLRLFNIVKILKTLKYHITFLALNNNLEAIYRPVLEDLGVKTYTLSDLVTEKEDRVRKWLKTSEFDWVIIEFWQNGKIWIPLLRNVTPSTKIIVDSVDVHFVREIREAEVLNNRELLDRALRNKEEEIATYRLADRIWVVTDRDKEAIEEHVSGVPVDIVPNIHERIHVNKTFEETSDLLFVGNFNHPPNRDAVFFFCRDILPLIKKELKDVKFYIAGNNPEDDIKALASEDVIVTGYVEDLSPYLLRSRVSVAPLRYGAGMKGKIGEALSWGLPVVTTSVGAEGMGLRDGTHVLIADNPGDFAEKVVRLYKDKELWEELSKNGKNFIEEHYSPQSVTRGLKEIFLRTKEKGNNDTQKKYSFSARMEIIRFPEPDLRNTLTSIVIPVKNNWDYTKICLDSIARYTDSPYEIVIVDNGSEEPLYQYVKRWKERNREIMLRYLRFNENRGFAGGCNAGAFVSSGDYLVFLNNDTLVTPSWLKGLLKPLILDNTIGITGPVSNYAAGRQEIKDCPVAFKGPFNVDFGRLSAYGLSISRKYQNTYIFPEALIGFCLAIKKGLFDEIGGFDERFYPGNFEDIDLSIRVHAARLKPVICMGVFVYHFGNKTFGSKGTYYKDVYENNLRRFMDKWRVPFLMDEESMYNYILFNSLPLDRETMSVRKDMASHLVSLFNRRTIKETIAFYRNKGLHKKMSLIIAGCGQDIETQVQLLKSSHTDRELDNITLFPGGVEELFEELDKGLLFLSWRDQIPLDVVESLPLLVV